MPYRGGGAAVNDLLGGHIGMAFLSLSAAVPHINTGKIRIVAMVEKTRYAAMPDIPTIGETVPGLRDVVLDRHLRAGRHAGRRHREAQRRHRQGAHHRRREGQARQSRPGGAWPASRRSLPNVVQGRPEGARRAGQGRRHPAGIDRSQTRVETFPATGRRPRLQEAVALHRQGQLAPAEKSYARILKSFPDQFDALHLLGLLKLQAGKAGEAQRLITSALKIDPRRPTRRPISASCSAALKRPADALASFDKALALDPDHFEALANRGNVLLDLEPRRRCAGLLRRGAGARAAPSALARQPRQCAGGARRGRMRRSREYDDALALSPNDPKALFNRANALFRVGRYAESLAGFDRLLALAPHAPEGAEQPRPGAAGAGPAPGRARRATPRRSRSRRITSTRISTRRWRCSRSATTRAALPNTSGAGSAPASRGAASASRSGSANIRLGARRSCCMPSRAWATRSSSPAMRRCWRSAGATVVLEVQPELKDAAVAASTACRVLARGETLPAFDVHCPLGSLPLAFKTTLGERAGRRFPICAPSEERVAKWRPRLEALPGKRVALAWAGNPNHINDRNRSIALARLQPLLATPGVSFVSIQRDVREGDRERSLAAA